MPSAKKISTESKVYDELVERFCESLKKSLDKEEEYRSLNTSDYLSSEYESEDEIKVRKLLDLRDL